MTLLLGLGAMSELPLSTAPPLNENDRANGKALLDAVLTEIDGQLAQLTEFGHNGPPVDTPLPLSKGEIAELRTAIAALKTDPLKSLSTPQSLTSLDILKKTGEKIGTYLDTFISSMAKSAGEETGKWVVRCGALGWLIQWALNLASQVFKLPT